MSAARRTGALVLVLGLLVAAPPSGASRPPAAPLAHVAHRVPPRPAGRAAPGGFGTPLAVFARAHQPDQRGCALGGCYGALVASAPPTYEFSELSLLRGRVVGYDQALARGTPLLEAELEVARLFPDDATMSQVQVVRHDYYGHRCAFYDISSKILSRQFGAKQLGGHGTVGVELATVTASGATTYNPRNLDLAIVVPTWLGIQDNC